MVCHSGIVGIDGMVRCAVQRDDVGMADNRISIILDHLAYDCLSALPDIDVNFS